MQVEPSWRVSQAVVAAEDSGFYGNDGVDEVGLVRALWGWVTGVDEGGSTITEQLAKVIYTGGRTGIADRVAQVALALKLDGHYTKTAVLSMYLSAVYFGNGYYGVLAASEGYFGLAPGSAHLGSGVAARRASPGPQPARSAPASGRGAQPAGLRPRPPGRDRGADPGGGGRCCGRAPRPAVTGRGEGRGRASG